MSSTDTFIATTDTRTLLASTATSTATTTAPAVRAGRPGGGTSWATC
ncbi:hypothetical protein [Streptomyces sp. NPDC051214]